MLPVHQRQKPRGRQKRELQQPGFYLGIPRVFTRELALSLFSARKSGRVGNARVLAEALFCALMLDEACGIFSSFFCCFFLLSAGFFFSRGWFSGSEAHSGIRLRKIGRTCVWGCMIRGLCRGGIAWRSVELGLGFAEVRCRSRSGISISM